MKRSSQLKRTAWTKKPVKVAFYTKDGEKKVLFNAYKVVRKPLRKTPLRVKGKSSTAVLKREIQSLLREIVIARDKVCILRGHRRCTDKVMQADHLITRSNSATFADPRLVVLLCRSCHMWKKYHKEQFDDLARSILPKERVELWKKCATDSWRPVRKGSFDWQMEIVALKNYLHTL